MRMLSTQTFNDLKLSSHLSQRQPLSVILSSINISQQSQLMQISSKNAPVCSTLISTLLLPPSDPPRPQIQALRLTTERVTKRLYDVCMWWYAVESHVTPNSQPNALQFSLCRHHNAVLT